MRRSFAAAAVAAVLCCGGLVRSQELELREGDGSDVDEGVHRIVWQDHWPEFQNWEYAATGLLAVGFVALQQIPEPPPTTARWTGGVLFDEPVRSALRLDDVEARDRAATASDVLVGVLTFYPLVVDPVLTALVLDADPQVAWDMTLINAQSMALTGVLTNGAKAAFDRERPIQTACREDPSYDPSCGDSTNHNSFFSGHTSMAFTGAGLLCAHHLNLGLYGSRAADAAVCGTAIAAATAVAALRVMSDRHYLTDVLVGAGVGFASGYVVPTLLHYLSEPVGESGEDDLWSGLHPTLGDPYGLELSGVF